MTDPRRKWERLLTGTRFLQGGVENVLKLEHREVVGLPWRSSGEDHTATAGGTDWIPGMGTKILHAK